MLSDWPKCSFLNGESHFLLDVKIRRVELNVEGSCLLYTNTGLKNGLKSANKYSCLGDVLEAYMNGWTRNLRTDPMMLVSGCSLLDISLVS